MAWRVMPARIARWEVHPYVAKRRRAQQRIHQRVEQHVSVRVARQPTIMRDSHAAQHQRTPGIRRGEAMHVVADAHARCLPGTFRHGIAPSPLYWNVFHSIVEHGILYTSKYVRWAYPLPTDTPT